MPSFQGAITMKVFHAAGLLKPFQTLSQLRGAIENKPHQLQSSWNKQNIQYQERLLLAQALPGQLRDVELALSAKCAERLLEEFEGNAVFDKLRSRIEHLQETLRDELDQRIVLIVDSDKQSYYTGHSLADGTRQALPPNVCIEMDEAAKCLALGRATASVFHLMRAMETCVKLLGEKLHVNLTSLTKTNRIYELTWHQILNGFDTKISAMPESTLVQKRKREDYSAVQSYLYRVKDAWRNPTMHPQRQYSMLEAEDILNHVSSFITGLVAITRPRKAVKP
jgi:hypothetical protein